MTQKGSKIPKIIPGFSTNDFRLLTFDLSGMCQKSTEIFDFRLSRYNFAKLYRTSKILLECMTLLWRLKRDLHKNFYLLNLKKCQGNWSGPAPTCATFCWVYNWFVQNRKQTTKRPDKSWPMLPKPNRMKKTMNHCFFYTLEFLRLK